METIIIANILGLMAALAVVTYYFVLLMKTERKVHELERRINELLTRKNTNDSSEAQK